MTNEEIEKFATALEIAIPLLGVYVPQGWIDFRSGVPKQIRFGLFFDVEDIKSGADAIKIRASFGSGVSALVAADQIDFLLPKQAMRETARITHLDGRWHVYFTPLTDRIEELTEALNPSIGSSI